MSSSRKFGIQSNKSSSDGRNSELSGSTPPDILFSPASSKEGSMLIGVSSREKLVSKHQAETKEDVYFGNAHHSSVPDLSQTLNDLNESYVQRAYRREQLTEQTNHSLLITILNYIRKDIKKKAKSFRIGVFTVFLVVSFITALKSLIDVAPIAFLKVAQD